MNFEGWTDREVLDAWSAVSECWENFEDFRRDDGDESMDPDQLQEGHRWELMMNEMAEEAMRRGIHERPDPTPGQSS